MFSVFGNRQQRIYTRNDFVIGSIICCWEWEYAKFNGWIGFHDFWDCPYALQVHCGFTFSECCVSVIVTFTKNIFLSVFRQLKQLFSNLVKAVCEGYSACRTLLEEIIPFNDRGEGVERRKCCP
ncbi:hypothetical protein D3C78_1609820 [compost metagenome]